MYFKINNSCDNKQIGKVNIQVERGVFNTSVNSPYLSRNIYLKHMPEHLIETPKAIIAKKAIVTDLLSNSLGNGIQLLISNKLKNILSKENHQGIQFFNTSIYHDEKEINNYWWSNPFHLDQKSVNFKNSEIYLTGGGGIIIKGVSISNFDEFTTLQQSLVIPNSLKINRLILNKNLTSSLLLIRWVSGGFGYYVSEKLKREIEDAGCTGIEFEPIEVS
jgi:hypothetical protein